VGNKTKEGHKCVLKAVRYRMWKQTERYKVTNAKELSDDMSGECRRVTAQSGVHKTNLQVMFGRGAHLSILHKGDQREREV